MNNEYTGIIVEESLKDNRIVNNLNVKKIHISDHENPSDRWHMYEFNYINKNRKTLLSFYFPCNFLND